MYGTYDSAVGLGSGLIQLLAVGVQGSIIAKGGALAAEKSIPLAGLRFFATLAGCAGGIINAVSLTAKANDARELGDNDVAALYQASAIMFAGTAVTSLVMAGGTVADLAAARPATALIGRAVATRIGAQGVLFTVGGTALTVSGIGLVLLGAGIALQVTAIAMTPTKIQRWVSYSYFGQGNFLGIGRERANIFPDWESELAKLKTTLQTSSSK